MGEGNDHGQEKWKFLASLQLKRMLRVFACHIYGIFSMRYDMHLGGYP
jgi:hypothetical protein